MGSRRGQRQAALNVKRQRELDARTAQVSELWASGERSVPVMAKKLGCSSNTIRRHLARIQDAWYEKYAANGNRVIGSIAAEAMMVIAEATKAWEESRGRIVTKRRIIKAVGPPPRQGEPDLREVETEVVEDEHFSAGDPRYLSEIIKAGTLIARVAGVYQRDINLNVDGDVNLTAIMQLVEAGRSAPVLDVESAPPASGNGNGRPD